jgi:hypothetical protein
VSAREEKLEQTGKRTTAGPARCTLAQLHARWGRLGAFRGSGAVNLIQPGMTHAEAAKVLQEGDRVEKEAMGGLERWRVASIAGADVHLVKVGGAR